MKLHQKLTLIRERSKIDSIAFQFCASMRTSITGKSVHTEDISPNTDAPCKNRKSWGKNSGCPTQESNQCPPTSEAIVLSTRPTMLNTISTVFWTQAYVRFALPTTTTGREPPLCNSRRKLALSSRNLSGHHSRTVPYRSRFSSDAVR